jgi:hypothetical protein
LLDATQGPARCDDEQRLTADTAHAEERQSFLQQLAASADAGDVVGNCDHANQRRPLSAIVGQSLANRTRAHAYGFTDGLWRLPILYLPHNPLSTAVLLLTGHSYERPFDPSESLKLQQLQLPRSGSNETTY